jgi:hypothetical protein
MNSAQPIDTANSSQKKWLDEAQHELERVQSQLDAALRQMMEVKNKKEDGYYSNAVLHARVKKEKQCQDLFLELTNKKEENNKILKQNAELFNKKRLESISEIAEIHDFSRKLAANLERWQCDAKNIRVDFEKAEVEFQRVRQKVENNKKNWYLLGQGNVDKEKEYADFTKKFGHVAELTQRDSNGYFTQCKSIGPLPSFMAIANIDPSKKTLAELKTLADLTEDSNLIQEAEKLINKVNEYNNKQKDLVSNGGAYFKRVDKNAHEKLISEANEIATEYFAVINELLQESRSVIDEIEFDQKMWLSDVMLAGDPVEGFINKDRREFNRARREMSKAFEVWVNGQKKALKQAEVCYAKNGEIVNVEVGKAHKEFEKKRHNVFEKYQRLIASYTKGIRFCNEACEKKMEITKKYLQAGEKFGSFCVEEGYSFIFKSRDSLQHLEEAIEIAEKVIDKNKKMISVQKSLVLQVELVDLIEKAISNNLRFWNRQISFFGSHHAINDTKVPHGIAQLYRDLKLKDLYSSQEILKIMKTTVKNRKIVGTGFFARRAETTTDKFYDLLLNLNIDEVTEDALEKTRAQLAQIRDHEGGLLMLGHFETSLLGVNDMQSHNQPAGEFDDLVEPGSSLELHKT